VLNEYPDGVRDRYNVCALLAIRAVVEVDDGRFDDALDTFSAAYELSFNALSEPTLYCHDSGNWMLWTTDACLDGVAEAFPNLAVIEDRLFSYFERRRDVETIRLLFQEEIDLAPTRLAQEISDGESEFAALFTGISNLSYSGLEASGQTFMQLLESPYHEVEAQMDDLIYDNNDASDNTTDLLFDLQDSYLRHLQSLAQADVFPVALKLMRYKNEHGEYPLEIGSESSIPLPVDPITGTPMIYLPTEDGFLIASPIKESGHTSDRFIYWDTARK